MGSHFVAARRPRLVRHIVLVVTRGNVGEDGGEGGARALCCDSTFFFLESDKWQDLGNLVASCHISQTSQTRNGYKWFILSWVSAGRTDGTEEPKRLSHDPLPSPPPPPPPPPTPPHVKVCVWAAHSAHPSGSLGEWQSDICIGKRERGENVSRLDLNRSPPVSNPAHISRFVCFFFCFPSEQTFHSLTSQQIKLSPLWFSTIRARSGDIRTVGTLPSLVLPPEARCIMYISAWCKQRLAGELLMHYSRLDCELTLLQ